MYHIHAIYGKHSGEKSFAVFVIYYLHYTPPQRSCYHKSVPVNVHYLCETFPVYVRYMFALITKQMHTGFKMMKTC